MKEESLKEDSEGAFILGYIVIGSVSDPIEDESDIIQIPNVGMR